MKSQYQLLEALMARIEMLEILQGKGTAEVTQVVVSVEGYPTDL